MRGENGGRHLKDLEGDNGIGLERDGEDLGFLLIPAHK